MFKLLWRDLLHVPQVGGVVRPEELVAGTLTPTIERPFVCAHKILARHDGMHLVPDDGLREVQPACRQDRRIVCNVAEPSPDIEAPTGFQDTSDVAEPSFQ